MSLTNSAALKSVLEKEKLNGKNFLDWSRQLRIVLRQDRKEYVLKEAIPTVAPAESASNEDKAKYLKHVNDNTDVACLMLSTMEPELQKQFESLDAFAMMELLKEMFQQQARIERYKTHKALIECKMSPGMSVSSHVLKMKGYIDNLESLGAKVDEGMAIDLILGSLTPNYESFIMNYNMHAMSKTITQLHGMLKTAEENMKTNVAKNVLMVRNTKPMKKKAKGTRGGNWKAKGKGKKFQKPKSSNQKEDLCFHCNKVGHWKRNCPVYLEAKKNGTLATTSGIYVLEINLSTSSSWVLDTGCATHICNNVQGLRRSRRLMHGEVDLRVGNGAKVAALTVGSYLITLPCGLVLELNNCYYVPAINRNLISVSCLVNNGYEINIDCDQCVIRKNGIFYGSARFRKWPICSKSRKR